MTSLYCMYVSYFRKIFRRNSIFERYNRQYGLLWVQKDHKLVNDVTESIRQLKLLPPMSYQFNFFWVLIEINIWPAVTIGPKTIASEWNENTNGDIGLYVETLLNIFKLKFNIKLRLNELQSFEKLFNKTFCLQNNGTYRS